MPSIRSARAAHVAFEFVMAFARDTEVHIRNSAPLPDPDGDDGWHVEFAGGGRAGIADLYLGDGKLSLDYGHRLIEAELTDDGYRVAGTEYSDATAAAEKMVEKVKAAS